MRLPARSPPIGRFARRIAPKSHPQPRIGALSGPSAHSSPPARSRSIEPKLAPSASDLHGPSDGKVGNRCCRVGESGVRWRPSIDRSGGAPPTPPLRSELSCRDMHIGVSRPLRALAGREEPAQHPGPVPRVLRRTGPFSPRTRSPASRSGRPTTHESIIERALGGLNPMGSEYRKLRALLPGQLLRDRARRARARDAARRRCSTTPAIEKEVVVVGVGDHLEVWSAERWRTQQEALDAEIGEVTERLGHPS